MDEQTPKQTERQQNTRSAAGDQASGGAMKAKGRVKESWGALTGNERVEAEGRADQVKGETRSKKGHWKQRVKAWIDRI